MARPLRLEFEGAFFHVMGRGNERRSIFCEEDDYEKFLSLIGAACRLWDMRAHAYALMGNHHHLLLETIGGKLSLPMRDIHGLYTQYFNRKYKRVGHLFQGRFRALLVDQDSYLLTLSRYIHQNPVKAKIVRRAQEYPWSSFKAFMGLAQAPSWLEIEQTLKEFGQGIKDQRENYRLFIEAEETKPPKPLGQLVLGTRAFLESIKNKLARASQEKEYSHRKAWVPKIPEETIFEVVCSSFSIRKEDLRGGWNHNPLRPIAMAALRDYSRMPLKEISKIFGVSYPAVSKSISSLEKRLSEDRGCNEKAQILKRALEEKLNFKTWP